jgi:hypothetical protein
MSAIHVLYHLIKADFIERTRRYSTFIIIGSTIFLTFLYLPPMGARYLGFNLGRLRGVYNSAWVGGTVTIMTVIIMALPGFYLVKNSITRDHQTGVGQILATTPLTKIQYTLGKMLSNWVYLAVAAAIALVAAMGIQLLRAEVLQIELMDYLTPYLLITLPMMALIASLAVLFESISWLRGGFGNVAFFFLFLFAYWMMAALCFMVLPKVVGTGGSNFTMVPEPTGAMTIFGEMMLAGKVQNPNYAGGLSYWELTGKFEAIETFVWKGLSWDLIFVLIRLAWTGIGIGIASLAAVFFKRFDPAQEDVDPEGRSAIDHAQESRHIAASSLLQSSLINSFRAELSSLADRSTTNELSTYFRCVRYELRLLLKGLPWWWYLVSGGLILLEVLRPIPESRVVWLSLAWLWPLLLWSQLGNREVQHNTYQMIFSTPYPELRQLSAAWMAGFILAITTGSGVILRFLLAGQWSELFASLIGATFIPSLSLALGVWSGSSKLFEVLYLVLWSLGPMNQILFTLELPPFTQMVYLDYLGVSDEAVSMGLPMIYLLISVVLFLLAIMARRREHKNG